MQLCFDFDKVAVQPVVVPAGYKVAAKQDASSARRARGQTAYHAGRLAEMAATDRYLAMGYELVAQRWIGKGGEIDIIMRRGQQYVFIEVKASRDFARAAERISRRQMDRICMAACEFCGTLPSGQATEMRMDAALVDQFGRIEIIEAAFGGH